MSDAAFCIVECDAAFCIVVSDAAFSIVKSDAAFAYRKPTVHDKMQCCRNAQIAAKVHTCACLLQAGPKVQS